MAGDRRREEDLSDAELVSSALRAEVAADRYAAFAQIFTRYHRTVLAYCGGRLQDPHAAVDAAAEAFAEAFRDLATLREPEKLLRWLTGIARNRCRQEWERLHQHIPVPDPQNSQDAEDEAQAYERSSRARQAQVDRMLDTVAATLTDRQQLIFRYAIREGLTGASLAGRLGTTPERASRLTYDIITTAYDGFGALILAREGRRYCPILAGILDGAAWTGDNFTAPLRQRILRHLGSCRTCDNCRTCNDQRPRLLAPYAPAIIPVLVTPTLLHRVTNNEHMDAGPPGPPPNGDAGQASPQSRQRNRLLLLAAGTALFAVGVGAGWLGLRPSAGDGSRTGLIRCVPAAVSAAGSSEHLILIEQWSFAYQRLCPGGTLSYSPVGSGAGIQQFIAGQASFVGSNRPLIPSEAAQARARCHGNAPLSLPLAVSSAGTLYVIVCQKGLPGDQARLVKSFLTYTTSPAGQALLTANGYTPLPATVLAGVRSSVRKLS